MHEGLGSRIGQDPANREDRVEDDPAGPGRGADGWLALPGMPNAHSHTFQRAMTGRGEGGGGEDSFWSWREAMYAIAARVTPEILEFGHSFEQIARQRDFDPDLWVIEVEDRAGRHLLDHGVAQADFNSFGSRRGNHEVMMRGTFANIRLRNLLAPGTEGGFTRHQPGGEQMSIFAASEKYRAQGTPLLVIAGKEYGSGSSRDWAAKGPRLLGVQAVIAESYERIHRSNLIGMGVLPLQFEDDQDAESLGLTGTEVFDIEAINEQAALLANPNNLLMDTKTKGGDYGAVDGVSPGICHEVARQEFLEPGGREALADLLEGRGADVSLAVPESVPSVVPPPPQRTTPLRALMYSSKPSTSTASAVSC